MAIIVSMSFQIKKIAFVLCLDNRTLNKDRPIIGLKTVPIRQNIPKSRAYQINLHILYLISI